MYWGPVRLHGNAGALSPCHFSVSVTSCWVLSRGPSTTSSSKLWQSHSTSYQHHNCCSFPPGLRLWRDILMKVFMIQEESPAGRRCPVPLAAKASEKWSWLGWRWWWILEVIRRDFRNHLFIEKCSFYIYKLFTNSPKKLITTPFNKLHSSWMKEFSSWIERHFLFPLCSWMYYIFSSSYLRGILNVGHTVGAKIA